MKKDDKNQPPKEPDDADHFDEPVFVEETPPPPQRPVGDVSLDETLTREANKDKKGTNPKNKKQILYAAGGVVLLLVVLLFFGCQPKEGPISFGICSVFLEMDTPYPQTLNYTDLEGSPTSVRIYYTSVDPFGEYKREMIECSFGPNKTGGMKVTKIERNRRPVEQSKVDEFNKILPSVMASNPYRIMPPNWKNPLLKEGGTIYDSQDLPDLFSE